MSAPPLTVGDVRVFVGDCRDVMRTFADESIDSCVTDPPYELGFMGKRWDASGIAYDPAVWAEVFRVLKPGGHLLAFGGTRTWHRIACAIEDVGFEIRDSIAWLYGSGFPKSLDISKAIDRQRHDLDDTLTVTSWLADAVKRSGRTHAEILAAFGFNEGSGTVGHWTARTVGSQPVVPTLDQIPQLLDVLGLSFDDVPDDIRTLFVTLNERKGQPGDAWWERKVIGQRTSAIANKDERDRYTVGASKAVTYDVTVAATEAAATWSGWGTALKPAHEPVVVARKPLIGTVAANVQRFGVGGLNIDACRIAYVSDADLDLTLTKNPGKTGTVTSDVYGADRPQQQVDTSGRWPANVICDDYVAAEIDRQSAATVEHGASRFFYIPKADRKQRPKADDGTQHPTVKPLDLIRHLVRLVTPPGGTVLDPFAGSGTTAEACLIEHFACVTIELTPDYVPLIEARLSKPIQPTLGGDL